MKTYYFDLKDQQGQILKRECMANSAAEALGALTSGKTKIEVDSGHFKDGSKRSKMVPFYSNGQYVVESFRCSQYRIPEWEGKKI